MEPNRLLLVWQPLEKNDGSRLRRIVGELLRKNIKDENIIFQYLTDTQDFQLAQNSGFVGFPAFNIKKQIFSDGVLETFLRRLPPRTRSDFSWYLENLGLSQESDISDFALLGYSEAKLPGDGFSITNPLEEANPPFEFFTEISGFRYYEGMNLDIKEGKEVFFEQEPENKIDPLAIRVMFGNCKIGYINRAQLKGFAGILKTCKIRAVINRYNGTTHRPVVKMFVEVS